jgi:hypothetical protein
VHRYYNPDLSPTDVEFLDWQNWLVLSAVQAFLGWISDNFLGVAVEPRPGAVTVHVALRDQSDRDDAALTEALFDLDVLLGGSAAIDSAVVIGSLDASRWQQAGLRFVFLRNPD